MADRTAAASDSAADGRMDLTDEMSFGSYDGPICGEEWAAMCGDL